MKLLNIRRAVTILLLLLFFTTLSRAELAWTPISSGTTQWLYDVHFVDKNTGYVVGNSGTILKTTDGGKTWTAQTSGTTVNLRSVYFVDANNGFAAGANKTILKTINGGQTWTVVNSGGNASFYGVHFPVDVTTGHVVGKWGIAKTTNGGTTWIANPAGTGIYYSVHFPTANTGYIVGETGTLLKTSDGGANWTTLTSGTTQTLYSVHFPSEENTGYVVGCGGTLLKTTNGGTTWTPQVSGTSICLNAVHFPKDANTGYVVGEGGVILKTTDGGSTWTTQTSGTTLWLRSAYFTDENTGIAVSDNGTILGMGDATTPSDIAYVHDGISDDIQFTNSSDTLSANWASSSDSETGIAKYYYTIGTSAKGTDVLSWTDNGASTTITKTELTLIHGATYYFSAKAENGAGLQSGITSSNGQLAYFIPPALTVTSPVENYLTSNPSLTVAGTAETGSVLTINGISISVDSSTGAFSTTVTLQEGTNTITAIATKYSLTSTVARTATLDTTPPALTLTAPQENVVVSTSPVNVTGNTEAGAALKINNVDTLVDSYGSFSAPLNLVEGENTITATATDAAGNQTTVTRKFTYSPNALFLAVDVPQNNTYTNNATQTVSGKTDPYAALTVNGQNNSVNSNGTFSTTTTLSKGTNTITVTATLTSASTLQATVTRTVIYDSDAPELTLETKADPSSTPGRPFVKFTIKSNEVIRWRPTLTLIPDPWLPGYQSSSFPMDTGTGKEFTTTYEFPSWGVYKGIVRVEAYDLAGNKGTLEAPLVNYNSQAGNDATLSDDDAGVSLYLPANALPEGTILTISTTGETPGAQGELQPAGKEVLIETSTTSTLTTNATLTLDYDESASLTDESKLRIYMYNESAQKWEFVGGTVNSATNEVTVQISHFSKYAVFADSSAPQISSLTPTEGTNTETNTTFTATLSDSGSGIDASVFAAKIDGTALSSSAYTYNAATGALSISAANLSEGAHTFTLDVKDNTGNTASASCSITAYSAFSGSLSSGLVMVSFPFTPTTTDMTSLLNVSSETAVYYWDASQKKYVSYSDSSAPKVSAGAAYWLKLSSSLSPRVLGNTVSSSGDYSIALKPGWNMFGNPFNFNVNLSDINVRYQGITKTLEEASNAGWLGNYAYTYGGASTGYQLVHPTAAGAKRVLEPWKGYWMHSAKDVELLIPPTKSSLSKADAAVTGAGNFSVTLKISDGSTTTNLVAGRSSKSEMLSLPPDNPETTAGELSASMTKNGSAYYADFNSSLSYTFSVTAKPGAAVTISMENNGLPQDYFMYLTDTQISKETLLSKTNYTFTGDGAEKSFNLSITKADRELFSQMLSLDNVIIYPNPVKNTAGISAPVNITGKFSVGLPVLSEIEIYSLTGKLLHKESSSVSYGGKGKVKMDSTNTGNIFSSLPNGVYVIRITFINALGEKTNKVVKLSIAR